MYRSLRSAVAAVCVAGALSGCKSSTEPAAPTSDDFSTNSLDKYALSSGAGGTWSVTGGALLATGAADQVVFVRKSVSFADGSVEAVSSRADDGGIAMRFLSADNYYMLAFRDDGAPFPRGTENLALYHRVNGAYDAMKYINVSWPRGTTHTVRLEAAGTTFKVYFDGTVVGTVVASPDVNDPAPSTAAGGVGVRAYGADATWVTSFDSFRWNSAAL